MASILKVDELQGIVSAGDITVTSEGGSATQSLQQGLAKAWFNASQTSNSINDSLNYSSLTDHGTGQFTVTFTNAMNSDRYGGGGTKTITAFNGGCLALNSGGTVTTTNNRWLSTNTGNGLEDVDDNLGCIFGDLA
jgi:hypothetical protein